MFCHKTSWNSSLPVIINDNALQKQLPSGVVHWKMVGVSSCTGSTMFSEMWVISLIGMPRLLTCLFTHPWLVNRLVHKDCNTWSESKLHYLTRTLITLSKDTPFPLLSSNWIILISRDKKGNILFHPHSTCMVYFSYLKFHQNPLNCLGVGLKKIIDRWTD